MSVNFTMSTIQFGFVARAMLDFAEASAMLGLLKLERISVAGAMLHAV